jgi:hypothetical protein
VLLRRTCREDRKVKHETVGNLSDLPDDAVDYVRRRLAGESRFPWKTVWKNSVAPATRMRRLPRVSVKVTIYVW